MLCWLLRTSRSGYLAWVDGKPLSARDLENELLLVAIRAAHAKGRGHYGSEKIRTELQAQGIAAGLNRIKRLRKQDGIRCARARKSRATTDSRHRLPVAPNRLDQRFGQTTTPNQVWVADITYVPTDEGWLYLAAIKDLHTCQLVGWAMDHRMTKEPALSALRMAYWRKKPAPGLIHHSDRGSQYCSHEYRALLTEYDMTTSMSRKGNCWDTRRWRVFFLAP